MDWSNPAARLLIDMGGIGEVRRSEFAFTAEVRSVAHELDEARGRLYQAGCAADLGDARCTVNLSASAFRANAIVVSTDGNLNFIADALNFDDAFFDGGLAAFTTGDNTGVRVMIKNHRPATAGASISLWSSLGKTIAIGDHVTLTAGCDKTFATCRARFNNIVNFRGFPHMPGNDVVMSYPVAGDTRMDGGSLFK